MTGVVLIFIIMLGTMYLGIATATEAAGMGVFAALVVLYLRKRLTWRAVKEALGETALVTSFIMFLVIGAKYLSWSLNYLRIPQNTIGPLSNLSTNPYMIIIIFQLVYIVLGCFLDTLGMMFITMPIFLPVLRALGFDPIWFGILFCINAEIGQITPPMGIVLYVVKGISPPEVSLGDVLWGSFPFCVAAFAEIILIMFFPQIAMFLPNAMFGS